MNDQTYWEKGEDDKYKKEKRRRNALRVNWVLCENFAHFVFLSQRDLFTAPRNRCKKKKVCYFWIHTLFTLFIDASREPCVCVCLSVFSFALRKEPNSLFVFACEVERAKQNNEKREIIQNETGTCNSKSSREIKIINEMKWFYFVAQVAHVRAVAAVERWVWPVNLVTHSHICMQILQLIRSGLY